MNFQFSEDAEALRDQARKFLDAKSTRDKARAVMDGSAASDAGLWQEIVALGWTALRIPDEHGGLGLSVLELCVLAEEVGRALSPVPFTSSVLLATEALLIGGTDAQKAKWLPKLADGSAIGTVALGEGTAAAPGGKSSLTVSGGKISGAKLPVQDAELADFVIVSGADGLYLVDMTAAGITREAVNTIDLVRKSGKISFADTPAGALSGGRETLESFLQSSAVLLAFEGVGGADAAMEMAVAYAKDRVAFGNKIGGYQAVKHRCADMYIKNQLARSHAYYGAWALLTGAPELAQAAAGARVAAIDAFQFAAEENVQLHGGIGFTWECDCQFFYRRARLLALTLGSKAHWADRLVRGLEQRNTPMSV
ncbi:MAG: acyl-CoA dehydrogenase family protein [Sphingomonadaceae bacterium]